mgnify:CR=1 FL=1
MGEQSALGAWGGRPSVEGMALSRSYAAVVL